MAIHTLSAVLYAKTSLFIAALGAGPFYGVPVDTIGGTPGQARRALVIVESGVTGAGAGVAVQIQEWVSTNVGAVGPGIGTGGYGGTTNGVLNGAATDPGWQAVTVPNQVSQYIQPVSAGNIPTVSPYAAYVAGTPANLYPATTLAAAADPSGAVIQLASIDLSHRQRYLRLALPAGLPYITAAVPGGPLIGSFLLGELVQNQAIQDYFPLLT